MNTPSEGLIVNEFPVLSWKFWRAYIVQMRPYLLFVSGIAGISGIAMGAFEMHQPLEKLIIVFIPFFLGYGFGQALTDCFQTDTDSISSPYRPLSSGTISIQSVFIISITGLIVGAIILYWFNPLSFCLNVVAVIGLATYSYVKRHFWYGGPFHNAWIVALLPAMAYLAISGSGLKHLPPWLFVNMGLTFFSYASFVLIGYLKDIEADRATGYKTFPVVFGWDKTILVGDGFAFATLVLFWGQWLKNPGEILFGLAATCIIVFGQFMGHRSKNKNEKDALLPILSTVRSFVLFEIAFTLHFKPQWLIILSLYYVLFEITLYLRPSRLQV